MTECTHGQFPDVESCLICEAEGERDEAIEERNEARALAFMILTDPYGDTLEERLLYYSEAYPWMKEQFDARG